MSAKIEEIVDKLSKLTVLEMSELKKALEEKWGVTAAAPVAVAAAAPAAGGGPAAAAAEEPANLSITIQEVPADKKIAVIKVIREITGLGLKEAKDMAESAPKVVKESSPKAEAAEIKKKLEDAGAKVSLK